MSRMFIPSFKGVLLSVLLGVFPTLSMEGDEKNQGMIFRVKPPHREEYITFIPSLPHTPFDSFSDDFKDFVKSHKTLVIETQDHFMSGIKKEPLLWHWESVRQDRQDIWKCLAHEKKPIYDLLHTLWGNDHHGIDLYTIHPTFLLAHSLAEKLLSMERSLPTLREKEMDVSLLKLYKQLAKVDPSYSAYDIEYPKNRMNIFSRFTIEEMYETYLDLSNPSGSTSKAIQEKLHYAEGVEYPKTLPEIDSIGAKLIAASTFTTHKIEKDRMGFWAKMILSTQLKNMCVILDLRHFLGPQGLIQYLENKGCEWSMKKGKQWVRFFPIGSSSLLMEELCLEEEAPPPHSPCFFLRKSGENLS